MNREKQVSGLSMPIINAIATAIERCGGVEFCKKISGRKRWRDCVTEEKHLWYDQIVPGAKYPSTGLVKIQ